MAGLHEGLGLILPDAVRDPYKATTEKLNRFVLPVEKATSAIIKEDIKELEEQIKKFERIITGKASATEFDRLVPYSFLGVTAYESHDYSTALQYYKKALIQNPNNQVTMNYLFYCNYYTENFEEALRISEAVTTQNPDGFLGYFLKAQAFEALGRLGDAIEMINEAFTRTTEDSKDRFTYVLITRSNILLLDEKWEDALSDVEKVLGIPPEMLEASARPSAIGNKCIALKKLGKKEDAVRILQMELNKTRDKYLRACFYATLDDKQNMLKMLEKAIEEDPMKNRLRAKIDPDFVDFREDSDFKALVQPKQT